MHGNKKLTEYKGSKHSIYFLQRDRDMNLRSTLITALPRGPSGARYFAKFNGARHMAAPAGVEIYAANLEIIAESFQTRGRSGKSSYYITRNGKF